MATARECRRHLRLEQSHRAREPENRATDAKAVWIAAANTIMRMDLKRSESDTNFAC